MTQQQDIAPVSWQFAWACGFFEGEGTVIVRARRLSLKNTDLDVLQRFMDVVGCGNIVGPYSEGRPRCKPIYTWNACRWDDVEPLARRMLPLLGARRRERTEELLANPRIPTVTKTVAATTAICSLRLACMCRLARRNAVSAGETELKDERLVAARKGRTVITDRLPCDYPFEFERPVRHVGVWAIQHGLNRLGATLERDGSYGPKTEAAVRGFQLKWVLFSDGVAGAKTQERLVRELCQGAYATHNPPPGILESIAKGESGWNVGAVNCSVPGGIDTGPFQRRVYSANGRTYIERALRIDYQARLVARSLRERKAAFYARVGESGNRINTHERAWRLAVLNHNWPYGADRLGWGHALSERPANWVDSAQTHFDDGEPVATYADWARYYSMGSVEHNHDGKMVSLVSGWPA